MISQLYVFTARNTIGQIVILHVYATYWEEAEKHISAQCKRDGYTDLRSGTR